MVRKPKGVGCGSTTHYIVTLKDPRFGEQDTRWNFCKKKDAIVFGRKEKRRFGFKHFQVRRVG